MANDVYKVTAEQQEIAIRRAMMQNLRKHDTRMQEGVRLVDQQHLLKCPAPHGLSVQEYADLKTIENGRFVEGAYETFHINARNIMARRAAFCETPDEAIHALIAHGVTPLGVANLLGFHSYVALRHWARMLDKHTGSELENHVASIREAYADTATERAVELLEGIGTATADDGTRISLVELAVTHKHAAEIGDDQALYAAAQLLPVYKAAVEVDARRREGLADKLMKLAKAYNPSTYGTQNNAAQGPVQHVSIQLDTLSKQPVTVNPQSSEGRTTHTQPNPTAGIVTLDIATSDYSVKTETQPKD